MAYRHNEITVALKGIKFDVGVKWSAEDPGEWEFEYCRPTGDDADFLAWIEQDHALTFDMESQAGPQLDELWVTRHSEERDPCAVEEEVG